MKKQIYKILIMILIFQIILQIIVPIMSQAITGKTDGRFNYNINSDGTSITITKYIGDDAEVVIPNKIDGYNVTSIGYNSFHNCTQITSVVIPEGVKTIEGYAFSGATELINIVIPNSVEMIDFWAFYACSKLKSIEIPEKMTEISAQTFTDCKSLTEVIIPEGITKIGKNAFSKCTSLKNITIPEEVTDLGIDIFYNCRNVTIKCKSNSKAHEYAELNKLVYVLDDEEPTLEIEGVSSNYTNKDVKITIKLNEKVRKVTGWNLSEDKMSLTKTFTKNTVENIVVKDLVGNSVTSKIEINNIDKTAPIIQGVENNGIYTSVTPKATDVNLDKVILTKDGQEVTYTNGEKIDKKGKYKLTVIDKAGNSTSVNFEIIEKAKITTASYTIDETNKYILGVKEGETKSGFISKITTNIEYKILNKNNGNRNESKI